MAKSVMQLNKEKKKDSNRTCNIIQSVKDFFYFIKSISIGYK